MLSIATMETSIVTLALKNPHPDSILWRSKYEPIGEKDDILREQAKHWGKPGLHYHQFLHAGENTLNLRLACESVPRNHQVRGIRLSGWLDRYAEVMLTPGWHNDTYAEEYHRAFFTNYARGNKLSNCGISDLHIGGLSLVPALLAGLEAIGQTDEQHLLESTRLLVKATHNHPNTLGAARDLTRIIISLRKGTGIRNTLSDLQLSEVPLSSLKMGKPAGQTGCRKGLSCIYLPESFTASLYLAYKYADDFTLAVLANAKTGGDNHHRGVVVGSVLECSRCPQKVASRPQVPRRIELRISIFIDLKRNFFEFRRRFLHLSEQ